MLSKIITVYFLFSISAAETIRYDDYSLYKVTPQTEEQVRFLKELQQNAVGFDFWKPASIAGDFVSVVSPPEMKDTLEHALKKRSIRSELMVENIQEAFDAQVTSRRKRDTSRQLYWTGYQTLDDINDWFSHLEETYPGVVSKVVAGQSHEGKNLTGVKISRGAGRRAFFLEAGQVGADWLSPVVLTYIVDQLVSGTDGEASRASQDFDWYIFPSANPDGFQYTQDSVRLWVKNRRPVSGSAVGVDLTKNWNSQWGVSGGSFTPADNNYIGLGPFSEPETRDISRYIESLASSQPLAGFLSFRTFGQRLVVPFAHTTLPLYNYDEMITIARRSLGSLSVKYNTQYLSGTAGLVSDGATGAIADWVKYRFTPPIAATFHLRDAGVWGYTLPVAQVLPSCEETFDALMAIIREARFIDVL